MDGSPACPFVAFDDDRDGRADRPDHRHRCFAEPEPAPRAAAHQEAYCLSSAFPVCPTFQAWARREAAQARTDREAAEATAAAAAASAAAAAASAVSHGTGDDGPRGADGGHGADEWAANPNPNPDDDLPIESRPRRNPPRDWAAPPPWATGMGGGAAGGSTRSGAGMSAQPAAGAGGATPGGPDRSGEAPEFLNARPPEGAGLAGSAADRLASGASIDDIVPPAGRPRSAGAGSMDLPSAAPDPDLAGLVGGSSGSAAATGAGVAAGSAAANAAASMSEEQRVAAGYPPATRAGRRPAVSSTRSAAPARDRSPHLEHVQHDGPAWEHARRSEAYPTIRSRPGFGSLPGLPRVAVLAAALGVAALILFFLPALLGMGGGEAGPSPTPSASAVATASPSPTPEPEPTPQLYVIKEGDTLSGIAKKFDLTLEQLLAANEETIKDPDRISVGDEIIIPVPLPDEVSGGSEESTGAVGRVNGHRARRPGIAPGARAWATGVRC